MTEQVFVDETAARLPVGPGLNAPFLSTVDPDEKDYTWGDVDQDGDIDLLVARKQPWTTLGGRRNVLFMNEGIAEGQALDGVLVDRTAVLAPDLLDLTNDRDIVLADLNGDGWLDIVTAPAHAEDEPTTISHPRVYINQQAPEGVWLGFVYEPERIPALGSHANFSAVAVGDVTGDDAPDLYFTDYDNLNPNTYDDRLLINDGTGFFTDESDLRMSNAMLSSAFGIHAVIVDINGDGWNDVVKSEGGPVELLNNGGDGFFDVLETLYSGAAYHFTVGFLDEPAPFIDPSPDITIVDDGTDRWLRNLGNGVNGLADFQTLFLPPETGGFGGNMDIVDLDLDGWNDVIVADVDIDASGCTRISDILLNDGNPPENSFTSHLSIPDADRQGVFDAAVFDINGDGAPDLVLGRCSGTQVWINNPPLGVQFAFPGGVPSDVISPAEPLDIEVELNLVNATLTPDSATLHVSINDGPFMPIPMMPQSGDLFVATLPAADCLDQLRFYFSAAVDESETNFTDPADAPLQNYAVQVANGTEVFLADDIEGDVSGWLVSNAPELLSGGWEQADPNGTTHEGGPAAPEDDASPDGTQAFVTGNGTPGEPAGNNDVDGGPTTLMSPAMDLSSSQGTVIRYARWMYSFGNTPDLLVTEISDDDGRSWVEVDAIGSTGGTWQEHSFMVEDYVENTSAVRVRFVICDCPNDSFVEAGIDDLVVTRLSCEQDSCPDLTGDEVVNAADLAIVLGAWGPAPGSPADLNGDGVVNPIDLALLLGGWGACP